MSCFSAVNDYSNFRSIHFGSMIWIQWNDKGMMYEAISVKTLPANTWGELLCMTGVHNVLCCLFAWPSSLDKKHTHWIACVSVQGEACVTSDGLRKVTLSSFVLHAFCLKIVTGGSNTQNVDDLYWITLQRRSETYLQTGTAHSHHRRTWFRFKKMKGEPLVISDYGL